MSSDFREVADHVFQLEAGCGLLALADGLPNVAQTPCCPLIPIFADAWRRRVCFHEQVMYPLLKRGHGDQQCEPLAIFERQHADINFADDELAETLHILEIGSDALACLLRNDAERQRDHLETEHAFFLPTIPEVLFPIGRRLTWNGWRPIPGRSPRRSLGDWFGEFCV